MPSLEKLVLFQTEKGGFEMKTHRYGWLVFFVAMFLLIPVTAHSATIYVPKDYAKIQDAIAAAQINNTILVSQGTYVENIDLLGKKIILKSVMGPGVTTIDGSQADSVIKFQSIEGNDTVIDGFTITNGKAISGGGVYCFLSSPTILNNNICTNEANNGGGIYCFSCSPIIESNEIYYNSANSVGGGIGCTNNSSPLITKNNIYENTASSGGGLNCYDCSSVISNNMIKENTAGSGGGIGLWNSPLLIINNLIIKNTAGDGGGLYSDSSSFKIINSTIVENSASSTGGGGRCWLSTLFVKNTIFWNNTASTGSELYISPYSALHVEHSDIQNGPVSIYVNPNGKLNWGPGMIKVDPLFVNPTNADYHLMPQSPCINKGTNKEAPLEDMEGDPRKYMGTSDIGADEFIGVHSFEGDVFEISESAGGVVNFQLNAGSNNSNRTYLILGSMSGTGQGNVLPGNMVNLPFFWDLFTNVCIDFINTSIFQKYADSLDSYGNGTAVFDTQGPLPVAMVGLTLSFAYGLYYPWDFVSNPVNVEVVP